MRAAITSLPGVVAQSSIMTSDPVGPSIRRYANAVVLIDSAEEPPVLLRRLKAIERAFGRRRGQRWSARVIDLDIVLWSGGAWWSRDLTIPHAAFREREFVLNPLLRVAPEWRDPIGGLTVRQLRARSRRAQPRLDQPVSRP